jgi:Arc/MetJ family transcription regulator
MRTNIEIDEELIKQAMTATQTNTKKAAVEACLREVVQLRRQGRIRKIFAIGGWEGSLAAMREGRLAEWEAEQGTEHQVLSSHSEELPAL